MRNSLRRLRKAKGFNLRAAGEGMGVPFQSLAKYEVQTSALPADVLDKAAKFYEVSIVDVAMESPDELAEDAPPYRAQALPLDIIPTPLLQDIIKILSALVPLRFGAERGRLMHGLMAATQELDSCEAEPQSEASSAEPLPDHKTEVASAPARVARQLHGKASSFSTGAHTPRKAGSSPPLPATAKTQPPVPPKPEKE